eukprot:jgi/Chrzof1/2038/UNPLg00694.t1
MDRHSSDKEQGENAPPSPVQSDSDPFMHDEDEELLDYECSDFYEDMDSPIQPMHAASDALSQPAAATALHQPLHHDSAKPACKSAAQRIIFNLSPSSAASTKSHATSPLDTAGELSDRDRKDRHIRNAWELQYQQDPYNNLLSRGYYNASGAYVAFEQMLRDEATSYMSRDIPQPRQRVPSQEPALHVSPAHLPAMPAAFAYPRQPPPPPAIVAAVAPAAIAAIAPAAKVTSQAIIASASAQAELAAESGGATYSPRDPSPGNPSTPISPHSPLCAFTTPAPAPTVFDRLGTPAPAPAPVPAPEPEPIPVPVSAPAPASAPAPVFAQPINPFANFKSVFDRLDPPMTASLPALRASSCPAMLFPPRQLQEQQQQQPQQRPKQQPEEKDWEDNQGQHRYHTHLEQVARDVCIYRNTILPLMHPNLRHDLGGSRYEVYCICLLTL